MSPIAADSLAETRARRRLGIAMAAMIPMIATTIRSSIRVKPPAVLPPARPPMARLRETRGGAPGSPPNLQASLVTLLQNLAGHRRDGDGTQGVGWSHASRREADHAARVAREAAHAGLPDVDRGGGVNVRRHTVGVGDGRD